MDDGLAAKLEERVTMQVIVAAWPRAWRAWFGGTWCRRRQGVSPVFFHEKPGTGLGLPTARRILREHGGDVALHS